MAAALAHPGNTTKDRILFLDCLRIFAFSTVMVGHTYYEAALAYTQDPSQQPALRFLLTLLLPVFYAGGVGVIVFFLVSGYIITHVLQNEQTSAFIIKRIFRIYPLYMFAILAEKIIFMAVRGTEFSYFQNPFAFINLVGQLLLLGDFFDLGGRRANLGGVDWTLRLEILFYLYMAALQFLNLFQHHKKFLPFVFGSTIILLMLLPAFPHFDFYTTGALNIYAPFFLLGAMFYLTEVKQTPRFYLLIAIILVFYQHINAMTLYQPRWLSAHFALLAFLAFTSAWLLRNRMVETIWLVFLSDLTYATYLFHAWLYNYLERLVTNYSLLINYIDIQALLLLLAICALTVRCIEKPSVRLGNRLIKKYL